MPNSTILDLLPLWGAFLAVLLVVVLSIEIGFTIGRRKLSRTSPGQAIHIGGSVGATLGLLAFMLAFTFSTATTRWDTKKHLVLEESNAIGTAFLRTDLLPNPQRDISRQLLSEYVNQHLATYERQSSQWKLTKHEEFNQTITQALASAKLIQSELWELAVQSVDSHPTPATSLYVSALNEAFDLMDSRVTISLQQRMPQVFWLALTLLAVISMALAGYEAGTSRGTARNFSSWLVGLAFSIVVLLVVALDRPQTSIVNQQPMLDLQQHINHSTTNN